MQPFPVVDLLQEVADVAPGFCEVRVIRQLDLLVLEGLHEARSGSENPGRSRRRSGDCGAPSKVMRSPDLLDAPGGEAVHWAGAAAALRNLEDWRGVILAGHADEIGNPTRLTAGFREHAAHEMDWTLL